ncbi:MAG TPA: pilus assembly protein N-terminal domain-containing protein [Sulfuricurvum sp.]|nr:pilus assembly protein N-terminal domain-containing protein [Sulfuricurvum sp.]
MKIILMLMGVVLAVFGRDIVVFENEFNVFTTEKAFNQVVVGNQDLLKVSVMETSSKPNQTLRLFGKKSGNTSLLIRFNDNTIGNYQVYVNQNLGFIQKMVNIAAPNVTLHRAGDGSTVLGGHFSDPHQKKRVYELLSNAGIDANKTMDLSQTKTVEKMIRTKLYLVSIDNDRAEELGGAVGLNYFGKGGNIAVNSTAKTYATFSGFLLDKTGAFANTGSSLLANLSFLQSKGVAKILDDTVLLSTEDQNASFHVGGQVYIPIGMTYNNNNFPTINLEEKEYGLRLTIKPKFLEKEGFMGINVDIADSEFDTDPTHRVQLGENIYVPAFRAKNIATDVVAQTGQVIALGGRMHTESLKQEEKIPLLGDIPVLGHLFKRTVDSNRANDLIFFLVPEIVDSNVPVNESGFYQSFKKEGHAFHDEIMNETPNAESRTVNSVDGQKNEHPHVSGVEFLDGSDAQPNKEDATNEVIEVTVAESATVKPSAATPLSKESQSESHYYEVTSPHIYVRMAPKEGKPVSIWDKGHRFAISEEVVVDQVVWAKIIQDCKEASCQRVERPLWISKNHIKAI